MDLISLSQAIQGEAIETLAQQVELFNSASNGAITLTGEGFAGDHFTETLFTSLDAAITRVDQYATNIARTPTDLAQAEMIKVKVAGGYTITFKPSDIAYIKANPAKAIEAISLNLSKGMLKDQLNTGILGCVAAIENNSAVVEDVSASTGITQVALNDGHAKFGDSSQNLSVQVMRGSVNHKLIGNALANGATLFTAGDVRVIDILGKISIITDAPALYEAGTPNKDKVLCLGTGAITIGGAGDMNTAMTQTTGLQRIEETFQADYRFDVGVKGYSWDIANGGKSPLDAEIATGTNWDKYATNDKNTAGVLVIGDNAL